jgi:O-antigen ligase
MTSSVALILWFILLAALLRFDPARDSTPSLALWVPVIWAFILGSRLPSQWIGGRIAGTVQAFAEGNPLDRSIDVVLILLSIGILVSRSFKWSSFFVRNLALTAYVFFALVSVCWSDFPFVAFKRWFRDIGNYLVILVVLSHPRPLEAVRTFLRRLCFLLIPLSILLIKYFPEIGMSYDFWTGIPSYVGVTTSKNLLGLAGMISGLFFFWDVVARWSERTKRKTRQVLLLDFTFIVMSLWVLNLARATTSNVCLLLGCLAISAAHSKTFRKNPAFLKALIPASFCLYLILTLVFDMGGTLAGAVGKDPTLTDRTRIWAFLLGMHTNPLLGTGYESFWMGSRASFFWMTSGLRQINEAHNGYLEIYLNLGLVGLLLIGGFVMASYRRICRRLTPFSNLASLTLAFWIVMLFFSVTEAGFRSSLILLMFLLGGISIPERSARRVRKVGALDSAVVDLLPELPLEAKGVAVTT